MVKLYKLSAKKHICCFASYCLMMICVALLSSCSHQPSTSKIMTNQTSKENESLFRFYQHWQGVPYRFGGTQTSGIDCSAFVQKAILEVYKVPLLRTTRQQVKQGKSISWQDKRAGDLVFFKTQPRQYHVGVYMGNLLFMHASSSRGVMLSRLDNPYWADKFWQIRRVTR